MSWPSAASRSSGCALPVGGVAIDVVEDARLQDEEGAVDPAFAELGLLGEFVHAVAFEFQVAEAGGRADGRHGGQLAVGAVKAQESVEVDVGHAVPPCQHERALAHVGLEALDPSARLGAKTGVDQGHPPVVARATEPAHVAGAQGDGQVRAQRAVVDHEPLDDLPLVAQGDNEIGEALAGVQLHDVPEDRVAADLDHRLGAGLRFLGQAAADASGQDGNLHLSPVLVRGPLMTSRPALTGGHVGRGRRIDWCLLFLTAADVSKPCPSEPVKVGHPAGRCRWAPAAVGAALAAAESHPGRPPGTRATAGASYGRLGFGSGR